jgi:hypothetical protein
VIQRRRLSYANITATVALFLALAGGVASADHLQVFSSDIVNGEVRGRDIEAGAVGAGKLAANSVSGAKVSDDSLGGADIAESSLAEVPSAAQAGDARTVDGRNASCPVGTRFFLGACWDDQRRPATTQFNAMDACAFDDRYLPHALESRAFAQRFRGSGDADVLEWTQTIFGDNGGPGTAGIAVSRLGGVGVEPNQALHPFRCVAPLVR